MSRQYTSIHSAIRTMNKSMPRFSRAQRKNNNPDTNTLVGAMRQIGFTGWDRVLSDQGVVRAAAETVFEDTDMHVRFELEDFEERSDAWTTVVLLLQDRGKAMDEFLEPTAIPRFMGDMIEEFSDGGVLSNPNLKRMELAKPEERKIKSQALSWEENNNGLSRILSLDESAELANIPTIAPENPRVGQMYLDPSSKMIYAWNGKMWADTGDRVE